MKWNEAKRNEKKEIKITLKNKQILYRQLHYLYLGLCCELVSCIRILSQFQNRRRRCRWWMEEEEKAKNWKSCDLKFNVWLEPTRACKQSDRAVPLFLRALKGLLRSRMHICSLARSRILSRSFLLFSEICSRFFSKAQVQLRVCVCVVYKRTVCTAHGYNVLNV